MVSRVASLLVVALLANTLLVGVGCLALERVEPEVVPAGRAAEVIAHGAGLEAGVLFSLEAGDIEVAAGVSSVDGATAVLSLPAAAPAGLYDVVARGSGQEARLVGALTLTLERLRIVFLDIGQGDATLVLAPSGEVLLIDGGPPGSGPKLLSALEEHAAGRLDAVVISHYDADHLAGVVELLAGADGAEGTADDRRPDTLWAPVFDARCDSQVCDRLAGLQSFALLAEPDPGDTLTYGQTQVVVEAAGGRIGTQGAPAGTDDNGRSVVLSIRWAGRSVLVLGDLTGGGLGTADLETPLASATGPVDVLRLAHHGSATSSNAAALTAWAPRLGILSVGTDNAYCHPAPEVLTRLGARLPRVLGTGAGIVNDGARCDGATMAPPNTTLGRGDIALDIDADGEISVDGEPL